MQIHGEYQLRFTRTTEFRLRPMPNEPDTASFGPSSRLEHWLRMTPRVAFSENLELVGQIDVPRGFIAGDETRFVDSAERSYDETSAGEVDPRWLYLDWRTPVGLIRVGQQPSHWGMGIIANDGDHPTLFGDYAGGARVERLLFATKPAGKDSPFVLAIAGDVVFKDATADLTDDELAVEGVLAAYYEDKRENRLGFYAVYRHQAEEDEVLPGQSFDASSNVVLLDSAGRVSAKIAGTQGHVFGEYEVAYLIGAKTVSRTSSQAEQTEDIRALGAATRLGFVLTEGTGAARFGQFVTQLEWGWASGDADPYDGSLRRFRFDPNYNVGLLLFDEVIAFKTARAANIASDRNISREPQTGLEELPSNGSVFGATYLNPTFVARPIPELDLKAGVLLAQTTAEFVDPVQVGISRLYRNYDDGTRASHDLGLEIDAGVEYRYKIPKIAMVLELGFQAGVLFPGHAFADQTGRRLDTQYIGVGRLGAQY